MRVNIRSGHPIVSAIENAGSLEWLVTNGIGGFASGTVANMLTRRYHGLLIAALAPPVGRTLLVSKLDETVTYLGKPIALHANQWAGGAIEPQGYLHLESFYLAGTIPVWRYAIADALLEKRIWMEHGANTTYVHYRLVRGSGPVRLENKVLVNYRDYHGNTRVTSWRMQTQAMASGMQVVAHPDATPFCLLSNHAGEWSTEHVWYRGYALIAERQRGLEDQEDHLLVGTCNAVLTPGQTLTIVASTQSDPDVDGERALARCTQREDDLIRQSQAILAPNDELPATIQQLTLAADQFLVDRTTPDAPDGKTIIAGYHWFSDWGRDTMIALPGLLLATGRHAIARQTLRTYAHFVDQGMIPNRFPDAGETPEYNTVDATLWFIEALRAYWQATRDLDLLDELYPVLTDIIEWHMRGTRYQIHSDPSDALLVAGQTGVQLTWMDVKVGDWVVTPRIGKAVEVNALWYNAVQTMQAIAVALGRPPNVYSDIATRVSAGFARFWNGDLGYCYDVIDGPDGHDPALRPNQLLAVALPHSPLSPVQQRAVVNVCAQQLLTSAGLRSLAPDHPDYQGRYSGSPQQRDGAYHQGTVWGWLMGPFVSAYLRVYQDPDVALSYLEPLFDQLVVQGLGTIGEIYDGDAPNQPRGAIAQAWSVAEVLRAYQQLTMMHHTQETATTGNGPVE